MISGEAAIEVFPPPFRIALRNTSWKNGKINKGQ
jgi:hypothetical protein